MLIELILSAVIAIAVLLFFMAFHKRVTIPFATTIMVIIYGVMCLALYNFPWAFILPVLLLIGWGVFCYKFKDLDFNKQIFSLAPDKNHCKNEGRIVGKVQPYYANQMKYNNSTIVQNQLSLDGGMAIIGSSGSGKTRFIINSLMQDVDQGKSVAFFNFKGDKKTSDELHSRLDNRVKVYELSYDTVNFSYDPLINLDEAGRVEAILNMRKWSIDGSDAHYKTGVQLFLQKSLREFPYQGGNFILNYYDWLNTYNVPREMFESYCTVMKLLELTLSSNVGSKIFSDTMERFNFDSSQQYVLIVSFTSSTKSLGTAITSLMLKDLMEIGTRKAYNPSLCLYIDELGSCESPIIVKDITEKGRSCGISSTLSMQDLNQLIIATNAPFLDSLLGTVNSYIIFPGATRQNAEKMSSTQIYDIDNLLMSLQKPVNGKPPTAVFISKYPVFRRGGSEVYRFVPYTYKSKTPPQNALQKPQIDFKKPVSQWNDSSTAIQEDDEYKELPKTDKSNVENTFSQEEADIYL